MAEEQQNVTIACSVAGQPQPAITWSKAIGGLPERITVVNGVMKIHNVTKNDGGTYACKAENKLGTAMKTVLLMMFSPLRFRVRPPKQLSAPIGSLVQIPCVTESDLRASITWMKDGKPSLPVESNILKNNTLVISNIKKSHEGSYKCKAADGLSTIETSVEFKVGNLTSCSVIRKYVSSSSGSYFIDPDGPSGLAPFTVYCNMSDKSGVGVTVISHDS